MSQSRSEYFKTYNAERKKKKDAAKATGNFPSLAWCLSLDDEQVVAEYGKLGLTPTPMRRFDNSPLYLMEDHGYSPSWTEADEAADMARQDAAEKVGHRQSLFHRSIESYVASLSDATILNELRRIDPEEWPIEKSTRYIPVDRQRRELFTVLMNLKESAE